MGLFGSTKIYVSSSVRNMAGDLADQVDYLKTTVVGSVISSGNMSMSENLQNSYIKGPGIGLRNFFRWAQDNYDLIGVPTATIGTDSGLESTDVIPELGLAVGESAEIQDMKVTLADYSYWAEQWMMANHPDLLDTAWTADFNETTSDIDVTFADTTTASFTPSGFNKSKNFLYVTYIKTQPGSVGSVTPGSVVTLGTGDPFPSITGWTLVSDVTTSGGAVFVRVYTRDTFQGTRDILALLNGTESWTLRETMTLTQNSAVDRFYQIDTQEITIKSWIGPIMFIYEMGSGNAVLDASFTETSGDEQFFPFIPIRLDNEFLSESFQPDEYALAKKAFKKAVGGKFDQVVDQLAEAESLPDIDYAYAVFGVSVNVFDNAARKYMFQFFKRIAASQGTSVTQADSWETANTAWNVANEAWLDWNYAQGDILDPLYGTTEPTMPVLPSMPASSVRITSNGTGSVPSNFDMQIQWQGMSYVTGSGLAKPGAKLNEVWYGDITGTAVTGKIWTKSGKMTADAKAVDRIRLYHQVSLSAWEAIDIVGMVHRNYIYGGKFVEISLREGLADPEESGFIVPLHYPTYKSMSLIDGTQMSTACTYLVFNSYLVKKTGLLGSLFFKIFLIVVIIAVIVIFPQLAPALVKAAMVTGTAIGLTGIAALIAGLVINAIVSMIITKLLMTVSIAVLGEKFGAIFGAVLSFVALSVGTGLLSGQSMSAIWNSMSSASNLLMLTNAVGEGFQGYIRASISDISVKMEEFNQTVDEKLNQINQAYAENLGYGNGIFDPMSLTDSAFGNGLETSSQFLARTMLTGADIAEISLGMISSMADMTLSTVLPTN